jgi:ERO1-like protein alpha
MRTVGALLALLALVASLALLPGVSAFGGGVAAGGGPGEFQANPFMSKDDIARLSLENAKREANANLPDPTPGDRIPGPSVHRYVDVASPCTVGKLHAINEAAVRPVLNDLVATTFFRYFKVDTGVECPFWVMDRMCRSGGGCHVCRCDEHEVPLPWRVEKTHPAVVRPLPLDFKKWDDVDQNMWAQTQADFSHPDSVYVNLLDNPESNTGYSGAEPRRIWDAIYQENCFRVMTTSDVESMCLEERVFYRLISGLHTSITVHVFARWKRDLMTQEWLRNQGVWNLVFGKFPERLDNLYFTLDFLLRSLRLAAPHLSSVHIDTGNAEEDARTRLVFDQLLHLTAGPSGAVAKLATTTAAPAAEPAAKSATGPASAAAASERLCIDSSAEDETAQAFALFESSDTHQLKDDLKNMFRNVSLIMNCVGCEKCRVWGKLNTLGIATALKITLAQPGAEREAIVANLQRNEIVSWVNTVASFSESVHFVSKFMELDQAPVAAKRASGDAGLKDVPLTDTGVSGSTATTTATKTATATTSPSSSASSAAPAVPAEAKASADASTPASAMSSAASAAAKAAERLLTKESLSAAAACVAASAAAAARAAAAAPGAVWVGLRDSLRSLGEYEPQACVMYVATTAMLLLGAVVVGRSLMHSKIDH